MGDPTGAAGTWLDRLWTTQAKVTPGTDDGDILVAVDGSRQCGAVALVDLFREGGELGVRAARGASQDLEGLLVADLVGRHEQADRLADLTVALESLAEVLGSGLALGR